MADTLSVDAIERQLRLSGVPREKARSVALQEHGIFVPPKLRKPPTPSPKQAIVIPASDPAAGRWEFLLPMPPMLTNGKIGSAHWATKKRAHDEYVTACHLAMGGELFYPAVGCQYRPLAPLARATITSVMYLGHKMDADGAMARHKWAIDYLVSRGVLVDDNPDVLTWLGHPRQVVSRKHVYSLHLTITAEAP